MNGTFLDVLALLAIAVGLVWSFRRVKLPAILAYLVTGLIAGPDVAAWVEDPDEYHFIAELGVVLLLFSLGLEFSLPKMIAMRRLVFGLGAGQVVICSVLFAGLAYLWLGDWNAAMVIGGTLALSSTAVVIKQLGESSQLTTRKGQATVAVLLFQDIAVVPMLIVIPLLASASADTSIWESLGIALVKGAGVVILLMTIGKWVLPHVFREIARLRTDELFVLATLLVALVAGGLTHLFGLSMALGAFLAGMMLGESKYKHQLEADIRPFRDILMGLFFITVGMQLDLSIFLRHLHWIILAVLVIGLLKMLVVRLVAGLMKEREEDAWSAGLMLFQMGEFGFVLVSLAFSYALLPTDIASLLVGVGVLGMAVTPVVIQRSHQLVKPLLRANTLELKTEIVQPDTSKPKRVLVLGFGRVGQTVSRFLTNENIEHLAIDHDSKRVQEATAGGANVFFGDGARRDILKTVHADQVELIIITFADDLKALEVLKSVREMNDHAEVIVRSRDDLRLEAMMQAGATQVVPDTLEASLMLVSQILSRTGVPIRKILARLDQARRSHYGDMHGFYPGETTDMDPEKIDRLQFLHAVQLTDNAYACGKELAQLGLDDLGLQVKSVRRDGQEHSEVAGDFKLQQGDVLLIAGGPRAVEAGESFLLNG
ncbi:Glutathione-regulated potassium-efflux system protein KefC [Pseudidiomarina piscicola]|uniref:Glutathione-regulated potassium-efflux system protein KefC n=1 Tax=Pseudidiomarina piscicola TaxID=2614830 RepID=A0A6S6WKB1_9GAMM|nr:monovalent cation:proton antiporter family protein [Pseudidiomarina piscicola]CAB0150334.1 Glutathione-regulated potassium-efflux system protein KefC [Pseudidiomarina piscicola]VZT39762.1 Glutathione-regulated potassium-efflux system protein KefC [Pseudomonas aeruginosa]